ncbi:IclR family transcriptional regulator [Nonomuraea jabiensis]|uniref:IclR family transcriptional regulator n=1 Tax=Nonomuraea jabiensis TaxID=882448 RepID=UPI003D74F758
MVADVARELGIARSTAHRLPAMLVHRDFAVQDEPHTYLPGPFLTSTQAGAGGAVLRELRARVRPAMEALCARAAETVNLMLRVGTEVRFLDSVDPDHERATLIRELDDVRARGYALNIDGTERGLSAIGATLRNGNGTALAALSISAPSARFGPDRVGFFAAQLKAAVREAEQALAEFPDA